jgi:hypothetical protein
MNTTDIARVCHAANREYCRLIGETPQPPWDEAPPWMRFSSFSGVEFRLANPEAPESAQHEQWMAEKINAWWRYGPIKDAEAKTHPCLVPYNELSEEQRCKDRLFIAIVNALKP